MPGPNTGNGTALPRLLLIFGLVPLGPAGAADAEFSRALNAVSCAPTQMTVTRKAQDMQIYEVSCAGNPPRTVGVSCIKNKCSATSGSQQQDSGNSGE